MPTQHEAPPVQLVRVGVGGSGALPRTMICFTLLEGVCYGKVYGAVRTVLTCHELAQKFGSPSFPLFRPSLAAMVGM